MPASAGALSAASNAMSGSNTTTYLNSTGANLTPQLLALE